MTTKKKKAKKRNPASHKAAAPMHRRKRAHKANPAHKPARRHAKRRNPGGPVAELAMGVGAGIAASILWDVIGSQAKKVDYLAANPMAVKGLQVVLGAGAAYLLRKRPAIAIGVAAGTIGPIVTKTVEGFLPASVIGATDDFSYQLPGGFVPAFPSMAAVSAIQPPRISAISAIQGPEATNYQIDEFDAQALIAQMMADPNY
jgi:hypothetical protein